MTKQIDCPFSKIKDCDYLNCLNCEHYPEELKYVELTALLNGGIIEDDTGQ